MRFDEFAEKYIVPVALACVIAFCLAMIIYSLVEFSS